MSSEKQFIEELRLEKYGINKDGTQTYNPLAQDLQQSVQLLSEELYEKDIHFILELIQNAEDNQYLDSEKPDLKFLLLDYDPTNTENSDGCLCIFNNEIGFDEKNIKAICAVGRSTKIKKQGYIGEKGIGFKSVFIVSHSPHIYSNGFQIKFLEDDPDLNLSYIVPYWLNTIPEVVQFHCKKTSILLPLKSGKRQEIIKELRKFQPETILFLNKLQNVTICFDENTQDKLELIKDSNRFPIVQLLAGDGLYNYWLKKEIFHVPPTMLKEEEKRKGIEERDIIVAFPLDKKKETGRVFAFLPTEIVSGLPFLINADFILSTNRETIQTDRPWNLWLRDCVADVAVNGFLELIQCSEYRNLAYSFIPLTDDLKVNPDFFRPICEKACSKLSDQDVVLTEEGKFALPKYARLPSDGIRNLFPDTTDRPQALRNLHFVAKEISKYAKQLKAIGVAPYSLSDFYNALSDRDWLQSRTIDWLVELYAYSLRINNLNTNSLRTLPILPIEGGKTIASSEGIIFFFSAEGVQALARQTTADPSFSGTYFLNQEFCKRISDNPALVSWLEKELCVRKFSLSTYLIDSLIPYLKKRLLHLRSKDILDLTQLIIENWKNITQECKRGLKTKIFLLLDDTRIIESNQISYNQQLVVPIGYDPEYGWHYVLQERQDRDHLYILSKDYLKFKENHAKEFQEYLALLSATKIPLPKTWKFIKGKSYPTYDEYIQNHLNNFREYSTREVSLETWMTPSFFHNPKKRENQQNRKAFLNWLEEIIKKITDNRDRIEFGKLLWFYYTEYPRQVPSGLIYFLTKTPWIKSSHGLKRPGEVFRKDNQAFAMFGDSLAYLEDEISIDLCKLLGVNTEITPEIVLEYLQKISNTENVTLDQLEKLYDYLDRYGFSSTSTAILTRTRFRENPLIYLPNQRKWYTSSQIIWEDASAIFGDLYGWLESVYKPDLKRFFNDRLRVKSSPDTKQFATAWLTLQDMRNIESQRVEVLLDKIYSELIPFLPNRGNVNWWEGFKNSVKIWTSRSKSRNSEFKKTNSVFVADDRDLQNLFSNDFSFAWKPERFTYNDIIPFFKELSLQLLSHSVQMELIKPNEETNPTTDYKLLTQFSKKLLCYLLYNQSKEFYENRFQEGMLHDLLKSQEVFVSNLTVEYRVSEIRKKKDKNSFWDKKIIFYI